MDRYARMTAPTFDPKSRMAFIAALVLAGATAVFCYLTVIAGAEPKCAGHEWPEGQRPSDSGGLLLGAAILTTMVWMAGKELPFRRWIYTKVQGEAVNHEIMIRTTVRGMLMMLMIVLGYGIWQWHTVASVCGGS
jgi:hypothetical protein